MIIKQLFLILLLSTLALSCSTSKNTIQSFEGKIVYQIDVMEEENGIDSMNYQIVYAKDSMLRIENFTPIGKQVYIKHIPKNRAYILMDVGYSKLAIQTIPDTASVNAGYTYSPLKTKEEIAGFSTKKIKVKDLELDTILTMNYLPQIPSKYSTAYNGMPGLPAKYYLFSDNNWVLYEILSIEEKEVNIDLFGIPSDYKIVTFDQFIEMLQEPE